MRHARTDYNRIQDPAATPGLLEALRTLRTFVDRLQSDEPITEPINTDEIEAALATVEEHFEPYVAVAHLVGTPIAPDEPVLLVRGKDSVAPATARQWAFINKRLGGENEMSNAIAAHADVIDAWQRENGSKLADAPTGALAG